jgi:tRNA threonylcarbamoyladenosine biosynthesis protein TsaB
MLVVGFDTATDDTAVCAWEDGEVVDETVVGPGPPGTRPVHASALLPAIERAAEAAGGWARVERITAGTGPGSFTGLRIGIATARALAAALGKPAVGVCSLDALALGMGEATGGERELLAAHDARRGQLFAALYAPDGSPLREPFLADPGELVDFVSGLSGAPLAAGSGALRFRRELSGSGAEIPDESDPVHRIAARHVCALGAAGAGDGALEPRYLRPPDAKRWRERDTSPRSPD